MIAQSLPISVSGSRFKNISSPSRERAVARPTCRQASGDRVRRRLYVNAPPLAFGRSAPRRSTPAAGFDCSAANSVGSLPQNKCGMSNNQSHPQPAKSLRGRTPTASEKSNSVPEVHQQSEKRLKLPRAAIGLTMITTKSLISLAKAGDCDAQFRLGYRFGFGRKMPANHWKQAFKWWKLSASQNHGRALFYLGTCYDFGQGVAKNIRAAVACYQSAADQGHPVAAYNLALAYRDGKGLRKNLKNAVQWLRRAALKGDADAQRDLGYCLHEGNGTSKNFSEAARWYRKAALQGDSKAQFNLALCYRQGKGVPKNDPQAVHWLKKASKNGHRGAKSLLTHQ